MVSGIGIYEMRRDEIVSVGWDERPKRIRFKGSESEVGNRDEEW